MTGASSGLSALSSWRRLCTTPSPGPSGSVPTTALNCGRTWLEEAAESGIWVVDRQLPLSDEAARELTISCGAALFNLRMAIRITGHQIAVSLLPDPRDESLLASVEIMTGRITPPTAEEQDLYDAIQRRHTYRSPFTGRRVPHNIITELLEAARKEKGWLRELYRSQVTDWLYAAARAEANSGVSPRT